MLDRIRDTRENGIVDATRAVSVDGDTPDPNMCASSTNAFISAKLNCWAPTASVLESTPPVPQNLITSAPYLRSLRTMARNASRTVGNVLAGCFDGRWKFGVVTVAAGGTDGIGGRHDARAGDVALLDTLLEGHVIG